MDICSCAYGKQHVQSFSGVESPYKSTGPEQARQERLSRVSAHVKRHYVPDPLDVLLEREFYDMVKEEAVNRAIRHNPQNVNHNHPAFLFWIVFVMREVFGHTYEEIGQALSKDRAGGEYMCKRAEREITGCGSSFAGRSRFRPYYDCRLLHEFVEDTFKWKMF